MRTKLTFLTFMITLLINPLHYSNPSFNSGPGCGGSGCHTSQAGILTVTSIGNRQVRITLTGTTSRVAGELVDAGGNVVASINTTSSNPFILTAPSEATYTVNAGYRSPSRRWDTKPIDISLPVELVSFTANLNKSVVNLKWITATETNNYGFDIERSTNGITWAKLGFVNGAVNSSSIKNYEYSDLNPSVGKYSYRLKQIDLDGSFEYSPTIEILIENPKTFELIQNYPNPFNPSTRIQYQIPNSSPVSLKIYDAIGNEVATLVDEYKSAGNYEIEFRAVNLTSGIYFYKLQSGNSVKTKKMLILK